MDEYEREALRGRGDVRYRDKLIMPRPLAGAVGLTGAGLLAIGITGLISGLAPLAILGIGFGLPTLAAVPVFGVVRLWVTDQALIVQVGLGGPEIAIAELRELRVLPPGAPGADIAERYPLKDGGWVLEAELRGGRVVQVVGSERRIKNLAAAVGHARRRRRPGVRVEPGAADRARSTPTAREPSGQRRATEAHRPRRRRQPS